jgi:hypothetical protein
MREPEISSVKTQFERLQRHWKAASELYDKPSFLDLSHSLRVWLEIGPVLGLEHKEYRFANLPKNVKTLANNSSYVYLFLPDRIMLPSRAILGGSHFRDCTHCVSVEPKSPTRTMFDGYFYVGRELQVEGVREADSAVAHAPLGRARGFGEYLSRPIVFFKFPDCAQRSITSGNLIRRIANEYGGSHQRTDATDNRFSGAVRSLMDFRIGDIPVPYMIALYIGKTVIESIEQDQVSLKS